MLPAGSATTGNGSKGAMSVCDKLVKRWGCILKPVSTNAGIHIVCNTTAESWMQMSMTDAHAGLRNSQHVVLGRAGHLLLRPEKLTEEKK